MKNKLKVLWFLSVPLAWFLSFKLVEWVQFYPLNCDMGPDSADGLCMFLIMTGFFGTLLLMIGGVALAIYMQD